MFNGHIWGTDVLELPTIYKCLSLYMYNIFLALYMYNSFVLGSWNSHWFIHLWEFAGLIYVLYIYIPFYIVQFYFKHHFRVLKCLIFLRFPMMPWARPNFVRSCCSWRTISTSRTTSMSPSAFNAVPGVTVVTLWRSFPAWCSTQRQIWWWLDHLKSFKYIRLYLVGGFVNFIFYFIYGISSFPLTNIFQDG